jgi:hypothetical protein
VQYVKGTEKMLRRMKEELNRYKERCELLMAALQDLEFLLGLVGTGPDVDTGRSLAVELLASKARRRCSDG